MVNGVLRKGLCNSALNASQLVILRFFFLLVYFLSIDYSIIVHTRAAYLLSANDVARYNVVIAGSR
jgi:hypothetical protein